MSISGSLGQGLWYLNKAKGVVEAYEVWQATQSQDALLNTAAKTAELLGIGIPLWFADKVIEYLIYIKLRVLSLGVGANIAWSSFTRKKWRKK